MPKPVDRTQPICRNRNATYRYEVLENLDCGIVLTGSEVKSLREHRVSLDEAFARFRDGELFLFGFHIAPYPQAGPNGHEPLRPRKLLARRHELLRLEPKLQQKGLTLIPISAFFNERGIAKIRLGLARGKKLHDKRQSIRDREDRRQIQRATRRGR